VTVAVFAFAALRSAASVAGVSIKALFESSDAEFVASFGANVFEFSAAGGSVEVSAGASGFADKTETLPVNAGIAIISADNINAVAAPIVTFDSTVAVPRGLKAVLETLLVKSAPASVLPG
jgi:hypothetical protein